MKKRGKLLIGIALTLLAFTGCFLYENNYEMLEKEVTIKTEQGKLAGYLALPKTDNKGVVIFVHGDGAQNATQDGGYKPLMERFAKQGFASISWNKLGVGGSSGDWLNQSMDDRAREVEEVIEWAKGQNNFNTDKIIIWGASQAGWVIPKIQQNREDISASILVGPAINWIRQGQYYTMMKMKRENKTNQEISSELNRYNEESEMIKTGIPYEEYKQKTGDSSMSEERYLFVQKNISSDAAEDLKNIKSPIFLILAEKDENVDSEETEKVYKQLLPEKQLKIKTISGVGHSMLNPSLYNSELLIYLSAIIAPKDTLISTEYLDYCEKIARHISNLN
ncbi:alpha/beta hydrolase family protein [Domibacillus indicus]|uniref:alpha/beta hydrolase family protein n=1 Tax=Domibacillus indicus TaxID=1437523 RepID=UPI000617D024|nr:alpha/beta hydrolase [Domibacillus indicus]